MTRFPDWKQRFEAWTQATEMRRSEASRVATDLATRGRQATDRASGVAVELAERSRRRAEQLADAFGELQNRLNVLGLATKRDVVVHSQLVGFGVSAAIDELAASSRDRDAELQQAVRRELQHELRALGLATKDDVVAINRQLDRLSAQARAEMRQVTIPAQSE